MKVALVTTPPTVRSGIGDYTRHLLPYLREHCDVQVFVEPGQEDCEWPGEDVRSADRLIPREHDQILYQLGNEGRHAFMVDMIRRIGGTVMQHDWVLFDLAMNTFPGLQRGGPKGHTLALREGGPAQAKVYLRNWLDRRRQRRQPPRAVDPSGIEGTILFGWHEPEKDGRWTSDRAAVRIPDRGVQTIEVDVHTEPGRCLRIRQGDRTLFEGGSGVHALDPVEFDSPELVFETTGIRVTREQREHGDGRRLGSFVRRIAWRGESGVGELDLNASCSWVEPEVNLSRDRFLLPLNRSVVRFGDAFIVHSEYLRERILRERNATTPVGVLHHGAEKRWSDEDRREARRRLGLDRDWRESFLITSFGGVQAHKRIDRALDALAMVRRERDDIRMVLAGSLSTEGLDPVAHARRLGLEDAVKFTGFVAEEVGWEWLHAGDVALNLRGPSSGGTSGGIFQAFSAGRPVIASDACEQRELPDSCTLKIPLGEGEVETLARTLTELADHPERREQLEAAARAFVENECHWSLMAEKYAFYLERFPRPRSSRRKLISLRLALGRRSATQPG
ncbi:MAG TPA: glycosyltransferase [Planctomycetes bacterium]|nr:glycosyltransferase [Planctomycetota bacterium]